jgi:hypothetical protein
LQLGSLQLNLAVWDLGAPAMLLLLLLLLLLQLDKSVAKTLLSCQHLPFWLLPYKTILKKHQYTQ